VEHVTVTAQSLTVRTSGPGLYEITGDVRSVVATAVAVGVREGLCTVFIRHTSASLTIQENADPSARHDLARWLERLVPDDDESFTHTDEGPDDMPSHIKSALTSTTLSIPIADGAMMLGRWQGIFVWEHRRAPHARSVVVQVLGG
jgi:secondary thiamine-phosphate synthase enzyme